jgi:hypothetical protein
VDKDPKKPDDLQDENGQQGMMNTNIPLTIAVSAFINSKNWFDWILHAAETLVIFYLTYQIIGKVLFVALVITPLLVFYISSAIDCYYVVCDGEWDDSDDDSGDDDDFHNKLK